MVDGAILGFALEEGDVCVCVVLSWRRRTLTLRVVVVV